MDILLVILVIILGIIAWRLFKLKQPGDRQNDQSLMLLQNQIQDQQKQITDNLRDLTKTLSSQLGDSTKNVQAQANENARIIREIANENAKIIKEATSEVTKVAEGQKMMASIADQLKNFEDILKNPKRRGGLGEYFLETVLKDVLSPGTYELQYHFKGDKDIVDAVIFYGDQIIPIDSKFSLENYDRLAGAATDDERKRYETALYNDLKTRIDETSKYVKPDEDTVNFAFMFIPSEALYYDLLVHKIGVAAERDLIHYGIEKRVYPVAPTTLYAYLQIAEQGLRQIEINKSAELIRRNVGELQKHLARYEEYMDKVGKHLGTTTNAYNEATKEFGKIDKDILKIGAAAQTAEIAETSELAETTEIPETDESDKENETDRKAGKMRNKEGLL